MKKLSVITVCFNLIKAQRVESFKRCLTSVHNQTYQNIEHLVIDGASSDGTLDIIREYSDKGWIKYISEPDNGIYDAMTKGAKIAEGDYVYFLNSDDYFYNNNVVKNVIKKFESSKADAVFGNLMPYVSNRNLSWAPVFRPNEAVSFEYLKNKNLLLRDNIHHQTIFYKKEIFDKISFFDSDIKDGSDWLFNCSAFLKENYNYAYLNKIITCFSLGGVSTSVESASSTGREEGAEELIAQYCSLRDNLREKFHQYIDPSEYEKIKHPELFSNKKIKFLGIPIGKKVKDGSYKTVYLFGIRVYKKQLNIDLSKEKEKI